MAKEPSKARSTRKPDTSKPKAAKPAAASSKMMKKISGVPDAQKPTSAKAEKTAKPTKLKVKIDRKSSLKESSAEVSKLASDILADRIVPTVEQIKAMAEFVLGHERKSQKPKKKKK